MKDLFSALFLTLVIILLHGAAVLIATYLPILGAILFAWVFIGIVISMLSALNVVTIDLSNLRK